MTSRYADHDLQALLLTAVPRKGRPPNGLRPMACWAYKLPTGATLPRGARLPIYLGEIHPS